MVTYVNTMHGYELPRRGGLGSLGFDPISATLAVGAATEALKVGAQGAGALFQNWLPAVTGTTAANSFDQAVVAGAAADAQRSNSRIFTGIAIAGAVVIGAVLLVKALK